MKNQELFNKTVSILVSAYQNNTLEHGSCFACAVGNLVCRNTGRKFLTTNIWSNGIPVWDNVFSTAFGDQEINPEKYKGAAKDQIDSTGYSFKNLAKIEFAFESANRGASSDDYMFNGLMAVVDVLMLIHEASQTETQEAKSLFVKEHC